MHKRSMPQARQIERPQGLQWDLSPRALEHWTPNLVAAAATTDSTISILEPIGMDPFTGEGMTAKRMTGILRSIGSEKDVTVLMNSPGGNWVEGNAIYNMLRDHKGQVTVKVLGMAASAASLITMAGDEILIAKSAFLMMHNMWVGAIGNRHDLRDIADRLEPFDMSMTEIYAARSGMDLKAVEKMLDKETFINGSSAVDQGFADALLPADEVKQDASIKKDQIAAYLLDMGLAKAGMPRSERRALLQDYKSGMQNASGVGTPGAIDNSTQIAADTGTQIATGARELMNAMQSFSL